MGRPWTLLASRLDSRRLLLRLNEPASASPAAPAAAPAVASAPAELDTLASAAPFGAALLDGPDPFAAVILEANPALEAMAPGLAESGRETLRRGDRGGQPRRGPGPYRRPAAPAPSR